MSEKSTDNDFEVIGMSDGESEGQNQEATTVVLQLPEVFQDSSHIAPSDTSITSSFVAVPPHVEGMSDEDDKSVAASESSCSHVGGNSGWEGSATRAFEILSIHGSNSLICQQCTFPNKKGVEICALCDAPVMTEPRLHQELLYDNQVYGGAAWLEKQAALLSSKIIECVSGIHCTDGMTAFTLPDLIRHVTSFMKQEQLLRKVHNNPQVVLRYHFSSDYTTGTSERIRRNGFRNPCTVSYNIEAAFDNHIGGNSPSAMMARIPESRKSCRKLGWIVVAIGELDKSGPAPMRFGQARDEPEGWYRAKKVNVSHGFAAVEERRSVCCLPLVSFDASIRGSDRVRQLMSSLSQLFLVDDDLFDLTSCSEVAHPEQEEGEELTNDDGTLLSRIRVATAAKAAAAKRSNLGSTTNTTTPKQPDTLGDIAAMATATAITRENKNRDAPPCVGGIAAMAAAAAARNNGAIFSEGGIAAAAAAAAAAAKRMKSTETSAASDSRPLKSLFAGGGIAAAAGAAKRKKSAEKVQDEKTLSIYTGEDTTSATTATAHEKEEEVTNRDGTNDGFRPRPIGDFGRRGMADPFVPVVMHDRLVVGAGKWDDADELMSDSDDDGANK